MKYSHELLEKAKQLRNDGYHYFKIAELINQEFGSSITMSGINHALNDYMRGIYRFQKPKKQKQAQLKAKAGNDFDAGFDTDKRTGKPFAFGQGQLADFYKWQDKTPEDIMRFVGVDPDEWEIEMFSGGQHEVVSKDSDNQPQVTPAYSFKFRAKPKTADDLSIDDLIGLFNERVTPVTFPIVHQNSERNLILAQADDHWGWTRLSDMLPHLKNQIDLIKRGYDTIVIQLLGDQFHSEHNDKTTTYSETQLDHADNYRAWFEAKQYYTELIQSCLQHANRVELRAVKGNHSPTRDVEFADLLHEKFPQVHSYINNDIFSAYRLGNKDSQVFIGMAHGNTAKNRLPMEMATKFSDLWSSTSWRELFLGHFHKLDLSGATDDYGLTVRIVPTVKPTDEWEKANGLDMSKRVGSAYEYDNAGLKAVYTL